MALPPTPDLDDAVTTDEVAAAPTPAAPAPARPDRLRPVLLAVLVLAFLASLGTLGWLGVEQARGDRDGGRERQAQREEAMSQARQFMLRNQTYGPDQLDEAGQLAEYRRLNKEIMTPKFYAEFEKAATAADQLAKESGVSRSVEVLGVGVETLDDDSGTVLVTGQISTRYLDAKGKDVSAGEDLFRVVVDLVDSDGTWLVDDFAQVSKAEQ
ncbi:hypothetical protein [Nocardioides pantholopis]|uniref:hypothetical protein n=1 Tax=Nocardioides pantholopis TaxID=2483798 RepID=UPI0013DE5938|nr:hypothetical protein [Nocardioides pantholopis]